MNFNLQDEDWNELPNNQFNNLFDQIDISCEEFPNLIFSNYNSKSFDHKNDKTSDIFDNETEKQADQSSCPDFSSIFNETNQTPRYSIELFNELHANEDMHSNFVEGVFMKNQLPVQATRYFDDDFEETSSIFNKNLKASTFFLM